jgi:outer membrane protein assembly factor BamD
MSIIKRLKNIYIILVITAVLLSGCAKEFNAVYKSNDYLYKYEFAKTCFVEGKFSLASVLLGDLVTIMKGTSKGEECLFL